MPRRGDNIRRRKDGRWEARYTKAVYNDPSKKYGSVYGKTYREAKEKRDMIIRQGQPQTPSYKEILFKDVLEVWQDANRVRLKESSVSRYQNLLDTHILPQLGSKPVTQLTAAAINRFLSEKLERGRLDGNGGLSASYVRSIGLVIGSAIRYGASVQICAPLLSPITKPSLSKKALSILRFDEQTQLEHVLLEAMNETKMLIYLTLYTGLRIGEACALRWEDINLNERLIYVKQTVSRVWNYDSIKKRSKLVVGLPKTESSQRCIPICSKLYTILKCFPFWRASGYILSTINGDFISPRTFEYRYKRIVKDAGLEPVNYHALRHTFATRCIECGVDIKSLSEILGHANVSITLNTYVHSSIELKRIQLEKLAS